MVEIEKSVKIISSVQIDHSTKERIGSSTEPPVLATSNHLSVKGRNRKQFKILSS